MAFPKILQKLFQNNGAGDKLNKSILPDISYNDLTNKPTIPAAVTVDSALSSTSTNPVQNKVVTAGINGRMPMTPGSIELNPGTSATHGGFIDFHYKGDSSEYTARIIEGINGKGRLDIEASGGLYVNGNALALGKAVKMANNRTGKALPAGIVNGYKDYGTTTSGSGDKSFYTAIDVIETDAYGRLVAFGKATHIEQFNCDCNCDCNCQD